MKKFLCSLIAIIMVFAFVGCMGGNNNAVLAKRINKNTSNLLNALNNLEEVTQEDIVISEFNNNTVNSTIINNTYSPYRANKVSKIKQLFRRNNLVEIKNMIDNNNQKFENEKISTNLVKNDVYSPKYISNEDDKLNYLDIYKSKIENLYNASSDCSFINSECIKCQQELKTSINECKSLCEKLANGEIKLTEEEMNLCSTYCNQMNSCYKKIKDCRGDCTNYLKTLQMLKTYFGSNSETLSTNYLNLLGCLENRLSCYKEALECVNNCNNLLKSNMLYFFV